MFIESSSPPRLALVLGSGGVRSIAALGIAEVLAAEGLRPDLIVGCSSGALFGATIASGMTGRQALDAATSLWSAELTEQRRWRAYAQLLAPKLFGFDAGFALRDDRRIAQRIRRAFGDWQLEDLPIPLRIVATEASTGARVVLRRGPLAQALRASVAVPLVFPSVEVDGRRLVDGVVSDPLPIAVASDAALVVTLGFKGVMRGESIALHAWWRRQARRSSTICSKPASTLRATLDSAWSNSIWPWIGMSACGRLAPCRICSRQGVVSLEGSWPASWRSSVNRRRGRTVASRWRRDGA